MCFFLACDFEIAPFEATLCSANSVPNFQDIQYGEYQAFSDDSFSKSP